VLAITPLPARFEAFRIAGSQLKRLPRVGEVPIPLVMAELDAHFGIARRRRSMRSRQAYGHEGVTGWRIIRVMMLSQIGAGRMSRGASSFGVAPCGRAPLNMVQRWLGHSRLSTTAIYTAACGPEEIAFMRLFWRASNLDGGPDAEARHERD